MSDEVKDKRAWERIPTATPKDVSERTFPDVFRVPIEGGYLYTLGTTRNNLCFVPKKPKRRARAKTVARTADTAADATE